MKTGKGTIVALPHTDFADHRVLRANPRDWFEVYKDTFDYLYANEPMAFLNVTVHCHFGGRPLMAAQIDRILKYIRGFAGVWLVRHDELAAWVKTNASPNGRTGSGSFRRQSSATRARQTLLPALQVQKSRPSSRRKRASTMLCTSDAPSTSRAARAAR